MPDQPGQEPQSPRTPGSLGNLGIGGDLAEELPGKAADMVDSAVGLVHDKAIRPLFLVARGIVYGLVAAVLGVVLVTMLSVGLIRLLDVYAFPGRIWASYFLVGFVFAVSGLALWSLRGGRQDRA